MSGWRRAAAWAVAPTMTAAGLLTACGIEADSSPRDLAVSTSTSTTTPSATAGNSPTVLYFAQGKNLVPITRSLPERSDEATLQSVLKPPTPSEGIDLSSSIPAGTELLGLERNGERLRVDLSKAFEGVVGPDRQQAIAQIVLSETGAPGGSGSERLTFTIDGDPFKVTSPSRGDVSEVTECDFVSLLAEPGGEGVDVSPVQETLLRLRHEELNRRCSDT
jgi:hypothetical protein